MGPESTAVTQLIQSGRTVSPVPVAQEFSLEMQKCLIQLYGHLFDDSVTEKIMRVAIRPPPIENHFPHTTDKAQFQYQYEPSQWWTSGFFPGSLWLLYERSLNMTLSVSSEEILVQALRWQKGLENEQYNKGTHDIGFMILPSFYRQYTHFRNQKSKDVVINAAKSLASRWSEKVQCLRSWDKCVTKRLNIEDPNTNFLVIIDNMMNLDLLFICSDLTGDPEFSRIAAAHARTTRRNHMRADFSTFHLINYDPGTGDVKEKYTVQGHDDNSCWSRGQAWALYGFATVYKYTRDIEFLEAANETTRYFCSRLRSTLDNDTIIGAVYWDFDAPRLPAILDTSAAMIACSGMFLLYQLTGDDQFLPAAMSILRYCLAHNKTHASGDTILGDATVNNNRDALEPSSETGLVYADYYFLEVGNRLLEMSTARGFSG